MDEISQKPEQNQELYTPRAAQSTKSSCGDNVGDSRGGCSTHTPHPGRVTVFLPVGVGNVL